MGIRKFFINKLSLGGIADSARTIVKVYKNIKQAYPELPQNELFRLTLKARRDHVKKLVKSPLYEQDEVIEKDVTESNGELFNLVFNELEYEYPVLKEIEINDQSLYQEASEIIMEICKDNQYDKNKT